MCPCEKRCDWTKPYNNANGEPLSPPPNLASIPMSRITVIPTAPASRRRRVKRWSPERDDDIVYDYDGPGDSWCEMIRIHDPEARTRKD